METLDANRNHSSIQSETLVSPTYLQNSTSNPKISDSINNNIQPPETLPSKNLMETLDANHNHSSLEQGAAVSDGSGTNGTRKRKSRCADDVPNPVIQLPDFMKDHTAGMVLVPKIQALKNRLVEIGRQFQSGLRLDDRPEGARSPSPEPVYDNTGIRINTRECRARERLNKERQEIISQILKNNPSFKPPVDYKLPKVSKKLFIPVKEYPGYNFIGLIIGPRGNTQKRMEKETGAMISVQGKGSVKEGKLQRKRNLKYDLSEYEDLHVFVEADTQEAVDAAASMVQKLLQPVDEGVNEHKRQQLKELAAYNGTIRDVEFCRLCGEPGHRKSACPSRNSSFKSDVLCKICGDGGHPTTDCTVKGSAGKKMDDEYQNFMAELGETVPEFSDVNQANTAIACMNGHQLEGRSMAVRVAKRPQPVVPSGPPALVLGSYPTQPPVVGGAHLAPYSGNPVPWGPPPPPTYPPYPPPPPGSTMYPQVMSQPFPPYGIQYPLAAPTVSSAATSLTVSSGEMQQSVQPAYSMPSFAYAPYYGVPSTASMPQSTIDHSQIIANVPWAPHPYIPPSTISARDKLI